MNEKYVNREKSRRVESQRRLRLMTMLRDLMRKEGRMEAAEMLGASYRTLARSIESGRLSGRMSEALERLVRSGEDSAAARQQERNESLEGRVEALEGRVEALAEEMGGGLEAVRAAVEGGLKALRNEDGQGMRQSGERPARVETSQGKREPEEAPASVAAGPRPLRWEPHRRLNPLIVTEEAEPDDEEVYGPAWPVIEEWRSLRENHPHRGRGLSWLVMEERILGLELAMLEEHGLTLPPEKQPLRGFGRKGQTSWRRTALGDTRKALRRRKLLRWVRRVCTLGLWRR